MPKRLFGMLLALVCAMTICAVPSSAESGAVTGVREGVVRILGTDQNGNILSQASGFAVGVEGEKIETFVTNNHAVAGYAGIYVVLDYVGEGGTYLEATVMKRWESPDLAIISLKTPISTWKPLPLMSEENVRPTQDVYALGFPAAADVIDDNQNFPSTSEDVTITKGIISKQHVTNEGADCFQTDATINGGNSGGPLITEDGYVIGVNAFGVEKNGVTQGINGAVYIRYIMKALDDMEIPYDKFAVAGSVGSSAPEGQPDLPPARPGEAPAVVPEVPQESGSLPFLAIGGVGVIALLVGLILHRRKKTAVAASVQPCQPQAATAMPRTLPLRSAGDSSVPPVPAGASGALNITGQGGQFAQDSFPVRDVLLIGRDPGKCNVVFPQATSGVSAMHCELRREGSGLILTDRGSTYGTFLSDKTKLEPGRAYPLKDGDCFYLGAPENSFRVTR